MKIDDSLNKVFDLEVIHEDEDSQQLSVPLTQVSQDESIDVDIKNARLNLYGLIDKGSYALDGIMKIAEQSESPRSYEVVTALLKTLADMNHQVIDLQEKKQKLMTPKTDDESSTKTINNNNAIFVGSTAELHKMLKTMRND